MCVCVCVCNAGIMPCPWVNGQAGARYYSHVGSAILVQVIATRIVLILKRPYGSNVRGISVMGRILHFWVV